MPRDLSPEEIAHRYGSGGLYNESPQAGLGTRFGAAADRFQAGLIGIGEAAGADWGDWRRQNEVDQEQSMQRYFRDNPNDPRSYKDINGVGSALRYARGLAIDSSPELAISALSGGAGAVAGMGNLGRMGLAAAANSPSALGDILQNQREEAGRTDLGAALPLTIPYVAADMVGLEGALARGRLMRTGLKSLDEMQGLKGAAARTGANAGLNFVAEGAGEAGQELVNQVGRIAVNPTQTLFNQDSNDRYLESFIGGGILGGAVSAGMGGWRRSQGYQPPALDTGAPVDLTRQGGIAPSAPQYNLTTQPAPLQDRINAGLGINRQAPKNYEQQFTEAYNAPSGQFVSDPNTGIERELTMGEVQALHSGGVAQTQQEGKTPSIADLDAVDRGLTDVGIPLAPGKKTREKQRAFYQAAVDSGIPLDSDLLTGYWTSVSENKFGDKTKVALQNAMVAYKKEQANGTSSAPVAAIPSSSDGRSPVADGSVGAGGPVPADNVQRGGSAGNPQPAGQQVLPVAAPTGQHSTVVNTQQVSSPFHVVDDDALEIARMTGNAAELEAQNQEDQGLRADAEEIGNDAVDKIVAARFADSKTAERDGQILKAYMTALRNAPQGTKVQIQKAIGKQFGVGAERVRQIGSPQALAAAGEALGYSRDQVFEAFNVADNAKTDTSDAGQLKYKLDQLKKQYDAAPADQKTALADEMARTSEQLDRVQEREEAARSDAVASGLKDAGVEFDAEEGSGMGGLDEDRHWQQESTKGLKVTNDILALDGQIEALKEALEEYESQGMDEVVQTIKDQIEAQQLKLDKLMAMVEENPSAVQKQTSGKVRVSEQASDGKAVAKQSAKSEVTAEDEYQTDEERAGEAWNQVANEYPDAPAWEDLSRSQRQDFIDYGPENWTEADVKNELVKLAKPEAAIVRASRRTINAVDQDGTSFDAVEAPLEKIAGHYVGVSRGIAALQDMGHQNAIDAVDSWMVTFTPVGWDAIYSVVDGKRTVIFNGRAITDVKTAIISTLHEVGHAIDGVDHTGGEHSSNPTFNLRRKNGEVVAMKPGSVADELIAHYYNGDDALSQLLDYPLNSENDTNAKMGVDELREELFAQTWAFSNLPGGMEFLRENLPATAAFMEKVHGQIQSTASTGQAQASQEAAGYQPGQIPNRAQAGGDAVRASRQSADLEKVIPKAVQAEVNNLTKSLGVRASQALNAVMFSEDLFKRAATMGLAAAKDLGRLYQQRAAMTGKIERDVIRIEQMYNRIPEASKGTGENSANMFVYDSTREGKWGFKPDWIPGAKVDQATAERFDALPKEAQDWIRAVFKHGDDMLKLKQDAVLNSAGSVYDARIAEAKAAGKQAQATTLENEKKSELARFKRLFAANEGTPYAPLRRFGDWVVVGKSAEYLEAEDKGDTKKLAELEKSGDNYHVSFAESYASALELQRQLEEDGMNVTEPRQKELVRNDMYGGYMQAFDKLRGNLDAELANSKDASERAVLTKAREMVTDLYLQSLAENSARKSELRRRGIAGEIDMLRSFSTQGRADAHFLASATYNPQMTQAIVKMRQQKNASGNETQKSMAFREIMARHEQSMKYDAGGWFDVASKASGVTSAWMLATSPMYYLQNLTQPAVISVPYMTGHHEYGAVWGQLLRAYHEMGALVKSARAAEGFDFTQVPEDVRAMMQTLVERGRIDIGMDTELGKVKLEGDTALAKTTNRVSQFFRTLAQKAEAINRVSTAMAAYRLELKKTGDAAAALEYADEVLSKTHGDYTRVNAPRLFNTPMGKVALQFRKFQLIQLTLLTKLTHDAFKGASPAERGAARKMLAFTLGHTGALAGVVGMPGFAAVAFIINKLADAFGDDDEPYNLEHELRKALGNGEFARVVMRGVPMAAGVDISSRVGMGTALSILPYSNMDMTRAGFNEIATGLTLGATGGLGARMWEALGKIKDGDYYRGLAGLMPKGLADAYRAAYEFNNGLLRTNGDTLISKDEIGTFDSIAKAIGLTTAKESERRFDSDVTYNAKQAFEHRTTQIKNEYVKARRDGDGTAAQEAVKAWQKLQNNRREAGFSVQPMSMLLKAPSQQAKRDRNVSNGVQYDKNSKGFVKSLTAD